MSVAKKFAVAGGEPVDLKKVSPVWDAREFLDGRSVDEVLAENLAKLAKLQYALYAENKQSLLVVLQALDAGGKDGVINHVFSVLNPQSCFVRNFKVPTPDERRHDFLWRIRPHTPGSGEVVVFNRSHYEDVLVARVHQLVPEKVWRRRYDQIRDFERYLAEANRTRVVKFFLHISKEEQLKRFGDRLRDPAKQWKISAADYRERRYWDDYMAAFGEALGRCSIPEAPWFVIPANQKKLRDLAVSAILVRELEDMDIRMPAPSADLDEARAAFLAEGGVLPA